jgi:glycosyltransferase involved in cell wall biosynthesis
MYVQTVHGSITRLSLTHGSLRILHVTPYSADAWAYGGIPRLVRSLARGLVRRGHQVTVCTTDACDESGRLPKREEARSRLHAWPPIRTPDDVEVRVFPNLSNRLAYHLQLFLPFGLNKYLSDQRGAFDVAHLHACRNVPGAIAAYHLHRAGVPYVLAPNGTGPRIERRQLAKHVFDIVMGQRVFDGATCVLAVSDAERLQLRALGVDASIIRVVPNPIDLDEFSAPVSRGNFRRRFTLPDASVAPMVMFLGKLTPRKRVDVLVRAFATIARPDAWLVIAGNDMGTGAATRSLVRSLGLEPRTVFTGLLRGEERLDALADADVVVYPSQEEVFGLVPLEALLSGTPVIVADDSGCGEIVSRTGGGQVVPLGDVNALARAISGMLDGIADWRAATGPAAGRIRATFGQDVVCAQIEHVYREMIQTS